MLWTIYMNVFFFWMGDDINKTSGQPYFYTCIIHLFLCFGVLVSQESKHLLALVFVKV